MKVEYIEFCIKVNGTIYPKRIFVNKEINPIYTDLFLTLDNAKINEKLVELYNDIIIREKE